MDNEEEHMGNGGGDGGDGGADTNTPQEWLKQWDDIRERVHEVTRRFDHPDGTPMEKLLAQLEEVTGQVSAWAKTRPNLTLEEKERNRRSLREDLCRLTATFEEMNRPSPLDLNSAICDGDFDEARRLLDAGVDPNALSASGFPMLRAALIFGHQDIAALLRERGATYGLMEASLAGDTDTLASLLEASGGTSTSTRVDVNAPDMVGEHAIQLAVSMGHTEAVRLLLAHGAHPDVRNKVQHTPLATACANGYPEIAHLLVQAGAPVGIVEAAYLGDVAMLKRLLAGSEDIEAQNAAGVTPLMAASACGHIECVRYLLEQGADPNTENNNGQRPLTWAVAKAHVRVIHLLIDAGADVNAVSRKFDSTPLYSAVAYGSVACVEALLARGADPTIAGHGGRTLLHQCAYNSSSRLVKDGAMPRIAALLLDAGADIEAKDNLHYTPLIAAAYRGSADIVRLLLERGADVRASGQEGYATPLSQVRAKDGPKDRREKSAARALIMEAMGPEYAVYDAAERGDTERLAALLDAGAPADQGIVFDTTMLDGPHFTFEDLEETPITAAAGQGHVAAVRLLLERGDAGGAGGVRSVSKDKALSFAESEGHEEVARLLRAAGAINQWPTERTEEL
jgi:cytohesin